MVENPMIHLDCAHWLAIRRPSYGRCIAPKSGQRRHPHRSCSQQPLQRWPVTFACRATGQWSAFSVPSATSEKKTPCRVSCRSCENVVLHRQWN
eukprot:s5653_g2.t1